MKLVEPKEDLRYAVEWYLEAVPPGSVAPPRPPQDPSAVETAIAEAEGAIAPLQLPTELVWLWRTWDPTRFDPLPYPRLTDPSFALDCWRSNAMESGEPRILFPVAYESHGFLLVELGGPTEQPAPVWYYAYTDDYYMLTYPSLASLFRSCAEAVEAVGVQPPADDRYEAYVEILSGPAFDAIVERHLAASRHAGRDRRVPLGDVRRWPEHWQRAQEMDDDAFAPRGATHTVASFTEATSGSGPMVIARMVGRFRPQGGGSLGPRGTMATFGSFSDASGSITVLLPHSVTDVGGRHGEIDVEVEVEATSPVGAPPDLDARDIQDAALAGDVATASTRAGDLGHSMQDAAARMPVVRRMVPLR